MKAIKTRKIKMSQCK